MKYQDYRLFVKRLARGSEAMTDAQRANPKIVADVQKQKELDFVKITTIHDEIDEPNMGGDAFTDTGVK